MEKLITAAKKAFPDNDVRRCIDEYIGKHFRFLENYIDGGYEEYVRIKKPLPTLR